MEGKERQSAPSPLSVPLIDLIRGAKGVVGAIWCGRNGRLLATLTKSSLKACSSELGADIMTGMPVIVARSQPVNKVSAFVVMPSLPDFHTTKPGN